MIISRLHISIIALALAAAGALPASAAADVLGDAVSSPPAAVEQTAGELGSVPSGSSEAVAGVVAQHAGSTAPVEQATETVQKVDDVATPTARRVAGVPAAATRTARPRVAQRPVRVPVGARLKAARDVVQKAVEIPVAAAVHRLPVVQRLERTLAFTKSQMRALVMASVERLSPPLARLAATALEGAARQADVSMPAAGDSELHLSRPPGAAVLAGGGEPRYLPIQARTGPHALHRTAAPGHGPTPAPLLSMAGGSATAAATGFGAAAILILFVLAVPGRLRTLRIHRAAWRPVGFAASLELPG